MTKVFTFYFSRVVGNTVYSSDDNSVGRLKDLVVESHAQRPKILGARLSTKNGSEIVDFSKFTIEKRQGQYKLICTELINIEPDKNNTIFVGKYVLDRQIVDIDGRKLVRVNDLRFARVADGIYLVAVDVGFEGLLRRLGVAKPLKTMLRPFGITITGNHILWDDVATVDYGHEGIKLAKDTYNLDKLHPSDLADIIEDMDRNTQMAVFASLDNEKAADVLEEMETDAQISLIESLSLEKAADLLEMMPADEAADILDELKEEKAEQLLNEMEDEASEEVRELMEYEDDTVGSIMTTDFISFSENDTVGDILSELRRLKPEDDTIYYIYIVNSTGRLISTVSLRDIIVNEPETTLSTIMNRNVVYVYDNDKLDSLNEIIAKYNLLAVPVVAENHELLGMVIINDVMYNLLKARRKRL